MALAQPIEQVQCFGRKGIAVAVTHCKRGCGLIKINGCPMKLVQLEILRPLGKHRFAGVDMCIAKASVALGWFKISLLLVSLCSRFSFARPLCSCRVGPACYGIQNIRSTFNSDSSCRTLSFPLLRC
ncbi:uncharacterized protein LOC129311924 [Prosopis cineraria]|uniref:uncharacterized protein LOC129298332 n=1 Tax=Prosopis cineraria TaxID=364024 RepID=UPI00240FCEA2|nr:uncharacterized protein LOC129298332 [Prosopis cineraria]XP_054810406.1 uncharacterized protein LOC129311924 [Prosopis cineraria]